MHNRTLFTLPHEIVKSTGPLILGFLINWALFGVLTTQVYYYSLAFPKDKAAFKSIVATVYIFETVQTIIISRDAFESFGRGFGDFAAVDNIKLTCLMVPVLSGVAACIVQLFYACRIKVLSNTKAVPALITALSICGMVGGLVTGIRSYDLGYLSKLDVTSVFISAGIWWSSSALCDVAIAMHMTYLLSRRDTGFQETHLMITRLTRITVETGACTALLAIVNLVTFFAWPHTNYYTTAVLSIAKLYSNTLLVLFNSRMRIVGGREETNLQQQSSGRGSSDRPGSSQPHPISQVILADSRRPSAYLEECQKHRSPFFDSRPHSALEPISNEKEDYSNNV